MQLFAEISSWISLFLCPVFTAGGISTVLYVYFGDKSIIYIWILGILGVIFGVVLAERIRRKRGTHDFVSELTSSKDVRDYNFEQWQKTEKEETKEEEK